MDDFSKDLNDTVNKATDSMSKAIGRLPGGGEISGALGAIGAIGAVVGGLMLLIASSKVLQKTIETFFKLVLAILRPIGDLVALLLRPILIMLLPIVRLMNMLFRPIIQKVQKYLGSAEAKQMQKEGNFAGVMAGELGVIIGDLAHLFYVLMEYSFSQSLKQVINVVFTVFNALILFLTGAFAKLIGIFSPGAAREIYAFGEGVVETMDKIRLETNAAITKVQEKIVNDYLSSVYGTGEVAETAGKQIDSFTGMLVGMMQVMDFPKDLVSKFITNMESVMLKIEETALRARKAADMMDRVYNATPLDLKNAKSARTTMQETLGISNKTPSSDLRALMTASAYGLPASSAGLSNNAVMSARQPNVSNTVNMVVNGGDRNLIDDLKNAIKDTMNRFNANLLVAVNGFGLR